MAEEPVIVVDMGSSSVKAGYAGDDVPTSVFPSVIQKWGPGTDAIEMDNSIDFSELAHPIRRGEVKDWDVLEKLWRVTLDEIGLISPESASVMLTESPRSCFEDRKKWAELLFETFRVPSICVGNSAPLSLFASGRTTGVVVECGAGITSTVPVFEGLALTHAAITVDYGGQDITQNLRKILQDHGAHIDMVDTRLIKERMAVVSLEAPGTERYRKEDVITFALPDGQEVMLHNKLLSECVEPLLTGSSTESSTKTLDGNIGIIEQLHESLRLCDDSVRKDLAHNIIISGGTSMLPVLGDRIGRDLRIRLAESDPRSQMAMEVRVVPDSSYREPGYTIQRKIAPWIGGSIIASLSTYKQLKITRQEWEESPESCIQTKCI